MGIRACKVCTVHALYDPGWVAAGCSWWLPAACCSQPRRIAGCRANHETWKNTANPIDRGTSTSDIASLLRELRPELAIKLERADGLKVV